ncbi:hypothetical protein [Psychroserpens sp.]|uniref:hypothetical protein n=1 Tax=Psychroserpens sp. TaxID=2020870 RepID=UPI00385A3DDC
MKTIITLLYILISITVWSQSSYEIPTKDNIPETLKQYRVAIEVVNFPKKNHPIKIKDQYYWKHNTTILCTESEIRITEYGAYLFYNDKWNLRKSYPLKDLAKTFLIEKHKMLQGQPYVWVNNWRVGESLFGGWAMWYFIGETNNGETVCGYGTIDTTDKPLN